jgi:hypothetical protein
LPLNTAEKEILPNRHGSAGKIINEPLHIEGGIAI